MKRTFSVTFRRDILSVLFLAVECLAASGRASDLQLAVKAQKDILLPYEPVSLQVMVTNTSSNASHPIPGRWSSMVTVEFAGEKEDHWKRASIWWRPSAGQPPLPPIELGPSEA